MLRLTIALSCQTQKNTMVTHSTINMSPFNGISSSRVLPSSKCISYLFHMAMKSYNTLSSARLHTMLLLRLLKHKFLNQIRRQWCIILFTILLLFILLLLFITLLNMLLIILLMLVLVIQLVLLTQLDLYTLCRILLGPCITKCRCLLITKRR